MRSVIQSCPKNHAGPGVPRPSGVLRLAHLLLFFFITLEPRGLSDTNVYEPYIRALLGTAPHCSHAARALLSPEQSASRQTVLNPIPGRGSISTPGMGSIVCKQIVVPRIV